MPDAVSKTEWERHNVIQVAIKINKNQDPEIFEMLIKAESKSGMIREILREYATRR